MKESSPNHQLDPSYLRVGEFVHIFHREGSPNWHVYYRLNGKAVRRSLKTNKKKEAQLRALRIERDIIAGNEVEPRKAPLIEDVVQEYIAYLQGREKSPKTIAKYQHCFKLVSQIAQQLNVDRIDRIDHRFIDAYRNMRSKGSKPKTVLNDLVTIRQLVNFSISRKLITKDPLAGLKFDKPVQEPQPFWTREQVEQILAGANPNYRPFFHFLADSGTRCGEGIWLTWNDVDFENNVIHIQPKEGWKPKTGDQRVFPMSPRLRGLLEKLPRISRWVFVAQPSVRCPKVGRQISDRRALVHLKRVLRRLDLPGHLHTFRHSFISHALTSGVAEAIVRDWVGHVDPEIMKRYTHIADSISKDAMANLFATDSEQGPLGSSLPENGAS